jgi:hypothetical protein
MLAAVESSHRGNLRRGIWLSLAIWWSALISHDAAHQGHVEIVAAHPSSEH